MKGRMHHEHEMHHEHHGHHKRADGGKVEPELKHEVTYAGQGSNVEKEAKEKKHGGKVKKHFAHGGHVEGHEMKHRMDRPGRKRGGGIGSDMRPLSTAAKVTPAEGRKGTASGNATEGP